MGGFHFGQFCNFEMGEKLKITIKLRENFTMNLKVPLWHDDLLLNKTLTFHLPYLTDF